MAKTTLADLISNESLHHQTRWVLNAIKRMKPSKEILASEAIVRDKADMSFRKRKGGMVQINGVLIGNNLGRGYFNGQIGPWKEIKKLIKAFVSNSKAAINVKRSPSSKSETTTANVETPISNENLNAKFYGTADVRKCWTNFELLAKNGLTEF